MRRLNLNRPPSTSPSVETGHVIQRILLRGIFQLVVGSICPIVVFHREQVLVRADGSLSLALLRISCPCLGCLTDYKNSILGLVIPT